MKQESKIVYLASKSSPSGFVAYIYIFFCLKEHVKMQDLPESIFLKSRFSSEDNASQVERLRKLSKNRHKMGFY